MGVLPNPMSLKVPAMGTMGSWVGWGSWEEEAEGGGKLRHGGKKGAVLTQLGWGGF